MSDVKVYPVKPSEIVLSHDECGTEIQMQRYENNRLYAHCRTCKRAVRLYAEPKYGKPGEVWPVTVALSYRGNP